MSHGLSKSSRGDCADLVEQIRRLVRHKPRPRDWDEQVGELCDQLIMRLQPIDIVRPKV